MKNAKRILSLFLCIILVVGVLPLTAFAKYENTHTNTGNQIEDIISVATTQTGYCEGNSTSQLDGTVAGSGNYTKYGKWYGINPGAWCAMFVSWCANQSGIPTSVIPKHASCDVGMTWFKNKGLWKTSKYFGGTYTPKRGDIIYFGSNPNNLNDSTHVGIVTGVDSTKVYTIEGNKSNKCGTSSYSLSSSYIFGYGTPQYSSVTSEYEVGKYVVTASSLNMRSTAGTDGSIVAVLKNGDYVDVTAVNGRWGYTTYGTVNGWVSLKYCSPVSAIRYNVSDKGIDFLKSVEGFSATKYWDYSQWSIGYGTGCAENEYPNGITEPEAEKLLRSAVVKYEIYLNTFLYNNNIDLNQNQYDALVSLTYNCGNIWNDSFTLRTYLINGISKYTNEQITAAFGEKVYAGGSINQGLVNRRKKEAALFLEKTATEVKSYTVTFNPNGGTITSGNSTYNMSVGEYYCDVIGKLPTATRTGYTFIRWYNEKFNYTASVAETEYFAVEENVEFIAEWKVNTDLCKITYNANAGTNSPASQSVNKGVNSTLTSSVPYREGYNFLGWATSQSGAVAYGVADTLTLYDDITLYAKWGTNPWGTLKSYSVTASSLNIRSAPNTSGTILGSISQGQIYNVTEISGSWGYAASNTQNTVVGWVSISPSYCKQVTGIFFELANGGTGTFNPAVKFVNEDYKLSSAVPAKTGYKFLGWSADQGALVPTYKAGATIKANEYLRLYDIWEKADSGYTITYNTNGGTAVASTKGKGEVTLAAAPTRDGYTFTGWTNDGGKTMYQPGDKFNLTANVTFSAMWSTGCYVFYSANGGDWGDGNTGTVPSPTQYGILCNKQTFHWPEQTKTLYRDGYRLHTSKSYLNVPRFYTGDGKGNGIMSYDYYNNYYGYDCWPYNALQLTNNGHDENTFEQVGLGLAAGATVTLYACWDPVVTYNMNYGDNALVQDFVYITEGNSYTVLKLGEGTMYNQNLSSTNYENYTGLKKIPKRTGYTLKEWNTMPDGSGKSYKAGSTYDVTEPLMLYAIWNEHTHTYTSVETPATCTKEGSIVYTCSTCKDTYSEPIPVTPHTFGEWQVVTAATPTSEGLKKRVCVNCPYAEEEVIPKSEVVDTDIKVTSENYKIYIENATGTTVVRLAKGYFTTASEIKNAPGMITYSDFTKYTIDGKIVLPANIETTYSLWIRCSKGDFIFNTTMNTFTPSATVNGITLSIDNINSSMSMIFIGKGYLVTYREIKNNLITSASNGKFGGEKIFKYILDSITYDENGHADISVCIRDKDNNDTILHTSVDVPVPTVTQDGLNITLNNISNVKCIKRAFGYYSTLSDIKAAPNVITYGSNVANGADSAVLHIPHEGELTVAIQYKSGYAVIKHLTIIQKRPTFVQEGNKVTIGNLDDLYVVRYAKGTYEKANAIKAAAGSVVLRASAAVNGKITINDLAKGTYTFLVQYNEESQNYYTITVS